jgi:hypothetical protein
MSRGGARQGAGRKTKAEELGLPMLIEDCIGEKGKRAMIEKIHSQAKKGSFAHQQLLMHYMFGKPVDHVKVDQDSNVIITFKDGIGNSTDPAT